ncbi:MAG: hypothetical protein ABIR16_07345 [Dokdonella sp.]
MIRSTAKRGPIAATKGVAFASWTASAIAAEPTTLDTIEFRTSKLPTTPRNVAANIDIVTGDEVRARRICARLCRWLPASISHPAAMAARILVAGTAVIAGVNRWQMRLDGYNLSDRRDPVPRERAWRRPVRPLAGAIVLAERTLPIRWRAPGFDR